MHTMGRGGQVDDRGPSLTPKLKNRIKPNLKEFFIFNIHDPLPKKPPEPLTATTNDFFLFCLLCPFWYLYLLSSALHYLFTFHFVPSGRIRTHDLSIMIITRSWFLVWMNCLKWNVWMNCLKWIVFLFRGILKAARRLLKRADAHAGNSSNVATTTTTQSPQKFYWLASDGWGKQSQVKSWRVY